MRLFLRKIFFVRILLAVILLANLPHVAHANLAFHSLSDDDKARVSEFIKKQIKPDIQKNFKKRMIDRVKNFVTEEPMSQETQDVITRCLYVSLNKALKPLGYKINELGFNQRINKVLKWGSKYGLYPSAFSIGGMGRVQVGPGAVKLGASVGYQSNLYVDHGDLKMANYVIYGPQIGTQFQFRGELYISLCFGTCFGDDASGYYVGLDTMGGVGLGESFFIEGGIDLTDMVKAFQNGEHYSLKDLYESKAIYVGFAADFGVGGGFAANILKYDLINETTISEHAATTTGINILPKNILP